MYIRKATRTYKNKTYTNYLLVESHLTPKGPRQKVVCSLGDLSPRPKQQWLELTRKLESSLTGQQNLFAAPPADAELQALVAKLQSGPRPARTSQPHPLAASVETGEEKIVVYPDRVRVEQAREAGSVHVGYQFWRRLEVDRILTQAGLSERSRQLTCAATLNRLIHPASELAMPDWIRSTAIPDILDAEFEELAEDALYRNLDRLHGCRVEIETALAEREKNLFNLDQTVFLYDLTSTYFEGRALANPKAKRGYSRGVPSGPRPDCKQVVVGLAVNRDGFPLAHEVLAGNRNDSTTVGEMLDALDQRVGLRPEQTVVVDRGMSGEANLELIRGRGLHYLVAAQQGERADWMEEFEEHEGFVEVKREPSPRNPFQRKSEIEVKMLRREGVTHVLCVSSERKEKDRAIRQAHEQRLLVDLEKLKRRVEKGKGKRTKPEEVLQSIGRLKERYPRVARYYQMNYDAQAKRFTYEVDQVKREKAEKLDGSYLLKTDRTDLSAEEVWRIYILLTRAEAAFRALKSPLAERPINHQKQGRVEAHIFLCVLAYHLLVSIEKTLLDRDVHTSWASVRETLKTHQVVTVVLPTDDGMELHLRRSSTPEQAHRELYEKLGVPEEIIRPRKRWVSAEPCGE